MNQPVCLDRQRSGCLEESGGGLRTVIASEADQGCVTVLHRLVRTGQVGVATRWIECEHIIEIVDQY